MECGNSTLHATQFKFVYIFLVYNINSICYTELALLVSVLSFTLSSCNLVILLTRNFNNGFTATSFIAIAFIKPCKLIICNPTFCAVADGIYLLSINLLYN